MNVTLVHFVYSVPLLLRSERSEHHEQKKKDENACNMNTRNTTMRYNDGRIRKGKGTHWEEYRMDHTLLHA